jgi:hypothetical protein
MLARLHGGEIRPAGLRILTVHGRGCNHNAFPFRLTAWRIRLFNFTVHGPGIRAFVG